MQDEMSTRDFDILSSRDLNEWHRFARWPRRD